jgi:putative phosphoribosyl transferase
MFEDRQDAGRKLGKILEKYENQDCIVLAIPRGGVPVGIEIARHLHCDFELIIARKLPLPDEPEAGFGAVAEDGSLFIHKYARNWIPGEMIGKIVEKQKKVIHNRILALRKNRNFPDISGRTVIITDDGIAMGSTMRAAIEMCGHKGASKIVVAVPVTGTATAREITRLVDDLVVLETPMNFRAVAQVYGNWNDLTDQEVIELQKQF